AAAGWASRDDLAAPASSRHLRSQLTLHLPERECVPSVALLAGVPPEEDRRDEPPQDEPADELHQEPGDELVVERRDAPDPRERPVDGVQQRVPEGEEGRRDRGREGLPEREHLRGGWGR